MMQAVYTTENIGHYGLAAEHYLHFTSPIRRYPDLVTHRLLKEEWSRRHGQPARETPAGVLAELAAISSERERAAMEAEREIAAYYAALFMKDKVGERFDGVVSAVVEFGIFVELTPLVRRGAREDRGPRRRASSSTPSCTRSWTHDGRAFRVGDEVEVEVVSASPVRRRIELSLVEEVRAAVKGRRRRGAEQVLAEAEAEVEAAARRPRGHREAVAPPRAAEGERRQRTGDGHREHGEGGRGAAATERGAARGRGARVSARRRADRPARRGAGGPQGAEPAPARGKGGAKGGGTARRGGAAGGKSAGAARVRRVRQGAAAKGGRRGGEGARAGAGGGARRGSGAPAGRARGARR